MRFLHNPHFSDQSIRDRADLPWSGGKRRAVYVALCVEHSSLRQFRQRLDRIASQAKSVWFTTCGKIAAYDASAVPAGT